jgi:hypothetical protein
MTRRVAVVAAILLAACSSDSVASPTTAGTTDQQAAALADGVVTFEEYEAAYGRFSDCLTAAGFPLIESRLDPVTEQYQYVIAGPAVEGGTEDRCMKDFYDRVEIAWVQNPDRQQDPNNQSAADVMRACLLKVGVSAPADATNEDLLALLSDNSLELAACLPTP